MKVKIHKYEVYCIDFEDSGAESCQMYIEDARYANAKAYYSGTRTVDWHDEIDINQTDQSEDALERLFSTGPGQPDPDVR